MQHIIIVWISILSHESSMLRLKWIDVSSKTVCLLLQGSQAKSYVEAPVSGSDCHSCSCTYILAEEKIHGHEEETLCGHQNPSCIQVSL